MRNELDGAQISVKVSYLDGWATTHASIVSSTGNKYYEEYAKYCSDEKYVLG